MADRSTSIQVHDFSGHPFQAELSRELAGHGLTVEHAFSTQYTSGKGVLEHRPDDPATLTFQAIETPFRFDKYSLVRRLAFERSFAATWMDQLTRKRPDLVIACNVPLFALHRFSRFARRTGLPYVLWHQDVFSLALTEELERRLWRMPVLSRPILWSGSRVVTSLEREIVASASRVVAIDDAFVRQYEAWDLDTSHVDVIPNWAPVDEIVPQERDNDWAEANLGRREPLRLLYAGTLGRKHNPLLLVELLDRLRERGIDAELTVISEGEGAELLAEAATQRPAITEFVRLLPFQPAESLSEILSAGDVLVALLEPGASKFSIPSKVLSYLAAGRPVLGIMPADNPAAVDIEGVGGCVVQPDQDGVTDAAAWLASLSTHPMRRTELGRRSRELAVERFGIEEIAKRFIEVIEDAAFGTA